MHPVPTSPTPTPRTPNTLCLFTILTLSTPPNSSPLLRRKQGILIPQELPTVRLPKRRNARRIKAPGLLRAARRNTEAQRRVVHAVHDDALVLGAVLRPAPDVRLDDVTTVQEGHLAVRLDPHLVTRVLRQDRERRDVQTEFESLGELAWAGLVWVRRNGEGGLPRQVPRDSSWWREMDVARLAIESRT